MMPPISAVCIRIENPSPGCVFISRRPCRNGRIGPWSQSSTGRSKRNNSAKETTTPKTNAPSDQMMRHRNSSRWSRNGISAAFFTVVCSTATYRMVRSCSFASAASSERGYVFTIRSNAARAAAVCPAAFSESACLYSAVAALGDLGYR